MKLIITGAAGFIGSRLAEVLAHNGDEIIGIDNLNNYYNPKFKVARLRRCGFTFVDLEDIEEGRIYKNRNHTNLQFVRLDAGSRQAMEIIKKFEPHAIIHLAAQPGVRYSMSHAGDCMKSNVELFLSILEACRLYNIPRLLYASSSSVYGKQPPHSFLETDAVDRPLSVYAVSKRTNEMLADVYGEMYGLQSVGMRFFSVYGEWGRPDMAPMLFADAIRNGGVIKLFNGGMLSRDFTYIDDVVESISRILYGGHGLKTTDSHHEIINIGRGVPVQIGEFVKILEDELGKKADICYMPMQPGEASATLCNPMKMRMRYGYSPATDIKTGVHRFAEWFVANHTELKSLIQVETEITTENKDR